MDFLTYALTKCQSNRLASKTYNQAFSSEKDIKTILEYSIKSKRIGSRDGNTSIIVITVTLVDIRSALKGITQQSSI